MITTWQSTLWSQFGAAIDDLGNAIRACPDGLWQARLWDDTANERFFLPEFWYAAYHALFWVDLYLTCTEDGFVPPPPFLLVEQKNDGPLPERPYTQAELLDYLTLCRTRCRTTIEALTDETAARRCSFGWGEASFSNCNSTRCATWPDAPPSSTWLWVSRRAMHRGGCRWRGSSVHEDPYAV